MIPSYNAELVVLSVIIAILASYTTLALASRVAQSEGRATYYWLAGGAFSMGLGIWSMHFIGMLAFRLPIPLAYDVPITLASMLPAMAAAGLALFVIRRGAHSWKQLLYSGLLMGLGIVAMHYSGMAAMKMQPGIKYDPTLFALSAVIAVAASIAALRIAAAFLDSQPSLRVVILMLGSATVMGFAIAGMHYTGMAAAHFAPGSICLAAPYGITPEWLAVAVAGGSFVILSGTLLISVFDARLASQAQEMLRQLRASNEQLRGTQAFLGSIVDNIPNMIFVKDAAKLQFIRLNRTGERITGLKENEILGKTDYDFFPKEQADFFTKRDRETLTKKEQVVIEEEPISTHDGALRLLRTQKLAILDASGHPSYLLGISEDITERKKAEEQLKIAANAFENTADGVIIYDAKRCIVSVNKAFTTITGYEPHEVIGLPAAALRSEDHGKTFYESLWRVVNERGLWQGEMTRRRKNGEVYPVICSVSAIKDQSGKISHYVTVFHDISSFKQYEEKLEFLAHHDALTQLPNRALFRDRFSEALLRAHRKNNAVAVLFIDLDRFKTINDSLGHDVGDQLLLEVAKRLKRCVRDTDVVARLGGDEFTVMLDSLDTSERAAQIAEKLRVALSKPYVLAGHDMVVSASIGISCYPPDGDNVDVLLKNADTAMYQAKARGRNNYQFFSPEMNARAYENLVLTNALRRAVEQKEFVVHYQPRYNLETGAITGVEALVRWQPPDAELRPPSGFIALAEESGLIVPIGEFVLREACSQLQAWRQQGASRVRVAVNLSPRQFHHSDLAVVVKKVLDETKLPGDALELEITEGIIMDDPARSSATLRELKAIGVTISVDDFGTGYSSLNYLKRFPLDYLKIDQSFVRDMEASAEDVAIVRAIIDLARGLRLTVIAEGVESEGQKNLLRLFRCDEAQGYLFSRPRPASDIEQMILGYSAVA